MSDVVGPLSTVARRYMIAPSLLFGCRKAMEAGAATGFKPKNCCCPLPRSSSSRRRFVNLSGVTRRRRFSSFLESPGQGRFWMPFSSSGYAKASSLSCWSQSLPSDCPVLNKFCPSFVERRVPRRALPLVVGTADEVLSPANFPTRLGATSSSRCRRASVLGDPCLRGH